MGGSLESPTKLKTDGGSVIWQIVDG
jgi:hypothetical protein